jgi:MFS family permease
MSTERRIPDKWSVLTNTTLGMLMATVNASILIISLPAIFDGLHLNPLAPGNVSYLLWMLMGYMLVTAVLVVTLGRLGDMYGRVKIYNAGFAVFTAASVALALAVLLLCNGIGSGLFSPPNTTAVMNAVPADQRGVASGIRATFQNGGMVLSIGVFFSLLVAGLSHSLPGALHAGLSAQGVPDQAVAAVAAVPPVSLMFAAFLGSNPIAQLLNAAGVLHSLPPHTVATLTSKTFLPQLLTGPFHDGLMVVFSLATALSLAGAVVSLLRGGVYIHDEATQEEVDYEAA